MNLHVEGPQGTVEYTIDFGDGTTWYQPPYDPCTAPMPGNWMGPNPHHVYATPAVYTVTVQVSLHRCVPGATQAAPPETTRLSIPVERVAGARPYATPENLPAY